MTDRSELVENACTALARIDHGTLRECGVALSLRVPLSESMVTACAAGHLGTLTFEQARDGKWSGHAALYRLRPDCGAVVSGRLPWAARLAGLDEEMPAVFDEQARQLGLLVRRIALRGGEFDSASVRAIRAGGNAFLQDGEAVCLGFHHERAIFNAELLEKCAQAYVLARRSGGTIRRVPWYVRYIAARRLKRDRERAAAALARGETPTGVGAY
jgi:hypothetical protein